MKTKNTLIVVCVIFIVSKVFAQDIKGAYIRSAWIPATTFTGTYQYSFTVTLLTDTSLHIPRPTIPFNAISSLNTLTFNLNSYSVVNGTGVSTYTGTYPYSSGYYPNWFLDTFRVTGIKNISSSHTQPILAIAKMSLNNISWTNTSCLINNFPPKLSVADDRVLYDPMVTDIDEDSLSFRLINCYSNQNTDYYIPNSAVISPSSGVVSFPKDSIGKYVFCMEIMEWKKNTIGIYQAVHVTVADFVMDIDASVGIKEIRDSGFIRIYPNPVKDKLTIEYQDNMVIDKINITNALGQNVFITDVTETKQEIDISFLPGGIYYLKAQNKEAQRVFKIVKE